jgi:SAM-dependent methyltransferase
MEQGVFEGMAGHDQHHWWYVARRSILESLIKRKIPLAENARILEIGCGTGHSLAMLGKFGYVEASEMDAGARAIASERLGRPVVDATLPELEGVVENRFNLIALLDVLEHVAEDGPALESIRTRLAAQGRLLLTVPAHPWMWTRHDTMAHHQRRYTKQSLREVLMKSGYRIELLSYYNSLLFPLAIVDRYVAKATGRESDSNAAPSAPLNALFREVFKLETQLVGRLPMPPGLSLLAIASAGQ